MIELGNKVKDIVTGFVGIATSRVTYLNGCKQICITPPVGKDGKVEEGRYVDIGQIESIGDGINVKARRTGGPQSNTPSARYRG